MDRKKQLQQAYKTRKITGGIYKIVNTQNNFYYLNYSKDMKTEHNKLNFAKLTNMATSPSYQKDWDKYGKESFVLEELELLEKEPEQDDREYIDDLKVLLELWQEKLPKENRYK